LSIGNLPMKILELALAFTRHGKQAALILR